MKCTTATTAFDRFSKTRALSRDLSNYLRSAFGALTSRGLFSLFICFLALSSSALLRAQTPSSISLDNGTLTFNATTSTSTCTQASPGGPEEVSYTVYSYDTFAYVDSTGNVTQLDASTTEPFLLGIHCDDPPESGPNPLLIPLPVGATITFTASGRGNRTASISSLVDPLYKVTTILYATPGNMSSDSYTNTTTNGTVTSVGSSFSTSASTTFSNGWGFGSASVTFGTTQTSGNSTAFTETLADASSLSNASASTGANTVSHNQDLFVIWLNPEAELTGTSTNIGYSIHTQYQNGVQEQPDFVEVTAQSMQSTNGSTTVPINILQKQYDPATGQYDLPGLAHICSNQVEYQNNCPLGGQCGCTPSDFAGILSADLLLNTTTAINPLGFDTSGVSACTIPSSTSSCRYVPVPASPGSSVPMSELLVGPNCVGCNRTTNAYTQTDSTSTTQTLSESFAETLGFAVKFGAGTGPSVSLMTSWTWTDTESAGSINGIANQIGYSLSSSTVGCYADVLVYEDTVFHTFVTQQAPGNASCP